MPRLAALPARHVPTNSIRTRSRTTMTTPPDPQGTQSRYSYQAAGLYRLRHGQPATRIWRPKRTCLPKPPLVQQFGGTAHMSRALPNLPLLTDQVSRKADSDGPHPAGPVTSQACRSIRTRTSTARTPTQTKVMQPTQQWAIEQCSTLRPQRRTNHAGSTTGHPD